MKNNMTKNEDVVTKKRVDRFWIKAATFIIIECVFLIMTTSLFWAKTYYGNIKIDEILFHLFGPTSGTADYIMDSYISALLTISVPILILNIPVLIFIKKRKDMKTKKVDKLAIVLYVVWFLILIVLTCDFFGLFDWIKMQMTPSTLIEEEYVDPQSVPIVFPEEKRNLICIFVESAETTNQDKANGGIWNDNYTPEMTNLAKNNVSFSNSDKLEGATVPPACGWTIAGLVSETAALPLKMYKYDALFSDNQMNKYDYFLPGATTLGDILEQEGYVNYFMAGSDFDFGGRTNYFTYHGNYQIFDYYTAIKEGKISSTYKEWWGFEDKKLYEYAKEKILELAAGDQPFNFSMLTADTHQEDGYVCSLCKNNYKEQYANVWRCASAQLDDFIAWCQEQSFYENTTIVIIGDHCSMDSDFYKNVKTDKHNGTIERKVYNCFINSAVEPIQEKNRKFTTMDMFPTMLASLGVEIEGNKLGLGTNLFSNQQTLAEKYGYEDLFYELDCRSDFYNQHLFTTQ